MMMKIINGIKRMRMKEDSIIQIEVKITNIIVGKIQKEDKQEIMIIIKMIHDNIAQVRGII